MGNRFSISAQVAIFLHPPMRNGFDKTFTRLHLSFCYAACNEEYRATLAAILHDTEGSK